MNSVNTSRLAFDDRDFEGGIPRRFERVVECFGPRIALIDEQDQLTYAELNAAANRLAHWLLLHCNQVDEPIALYFGHHLAAVIAVVGVLKAGKTYCALDVSAPAERTLTILEELGCRILLTDDSNFAQAEALPGKVCKAISLSTAEHALATNPQVEIHPKSFAAVYYTSGSTGTPIGVRRTHWYYLKRAQLQVDFLATAATDTLSMLNSLCFGSSALDLYSAILGGAALCFYDTRQMGVAGLTEWIQKFQVTQLHLPNISLRAWLDTVPEDRVFQSLNNVRPSFRLCREDLRRLWPHLPEQATIMHALSATETGPVCRIKLQRATPLEGEVIPVGYPVPGVEILLLEDGRLAAPGEVGEIYVHSPYTGHYWRRPELYEEKLIDDPLGSGRRFYRLGDLGRLRPDGMLELVGRKDFQVKIRGYRVEIEEVEIALERMEGVRQAAVIARSDTLGEKQLVAYVVPDGSDRVTLEKLRAYLRTILPDYAVPARFVLMDHLPLVNGKVARKALPLPGSARPALDTPFVAPRNELEQQLADIWAEVLDLDAIGVEDDFFDLGGDSILAMRLNLNIEQRFGSQVQWTFFEQPTVANLATVVAGQAPQAAAFPHRPGQARKPVPHWRRGPIVRRFALPYGIGVKLQPLWLRLPRLRQQLWHESAIFREWLAWLDIDDPNGSRLEQNLLANTWVRWRNAQMKRADVRDRWSSATGAEHLASVLASGRPLVLMAAHTTLTRKIMHLMLLTKAGRPIMSLNTRYADPASRLEAISRAEMTLRDGGILVVASDGVRGTTGVELPFLGHRWLFRSGAAELAQRTQATLMPVFTTLEPGGRVKVTIHPPLHCTPPAGLNWVRDVMSQYAELLAALWRENLSTIPWLKLRQVGASPLLEPKASSWMPGVG